jgi:hypothetical protein
MRGYFRIKSMNSIPVTKNQNIVTIEPESDIIKDSKRISISSSCTFVSELTPSLLDFLPELNYRWDNTRSLSSLDSNNPLFTKPIVELFDNPFWTSTPIGAIRREISANGSDNKEEPLKSYETVDYSKEPANSPNLFLTAINTTPIEYPDIYPIILSNSKYLEKASEITTASSNMLRHPNQIRAFSRRAISFQKRQWFTNICCISLCPLLICLVSFILQTIIQILVTKGIDEDYQLVYCSKENGINQQNWPIYNVKGKTLNRMPASTYEGATKPVQHLNFLQRSIFLDLSSFQALDVYASVSITGSATCIKGLIYRCKLVWSTVSKRRK